MKTDTTTGNERVVKGKKERGGKKKERTAADFQSTG